jgi:hypothetical protein
MASTDARPIPQKNVAYRVTFPILDADGDLVTGATGLDSEVSKDGGTFADCTSEATEIATSSGMYFLDLTSTEMNADTVAVIVKTTSSGAKTTPIVMYPEEAGDIRVNVTQVNGTNQTAGDIMADTNDIQTRLPAALVSGRMDASVGAMAANVLTATAINADAITDAKVAADVTIASVTGAVGSVTGNVGGNVNGSVGSVVGAVGSVTGNVGGNVTGSVGSVATGGITAGSIAADAIGASELAADAVTEIQSGLATAAALATVDTVVDAIQAKTDNLPSDPADASVVAGLIAGVDAKVDIIDSNVDAVLGDTNELQTDWANGGRLDNILDARASQTSVDDLPTNAELATALGTADDAVLAQVALLKAVTDKLDDTLEDDGGTYRFTANALEEGPGGGSAPTAAEIADAVWEEAIADHSGTAGSTAEALGAAGAAGDPWTTQLPGSYGSGTAGKIIGDNINATISGRASQTSLDTVDGIVDAILADTNELQTDWVNGGRLDNILDARASQTSVDDIPTNAELSTALAGADDAVLAAIAALNNLSQANVRTAIGLASANLDTQLGDIPTNAELAAALASADDATLAAIAALNNLSSAQAQTAAAAALSAYDAPTRAEATSDKDEVLAAVDANETKIDAIKTKTDSLTFTVSNRIDANVTSVANAAIGGVGTELDPWGPA